MNADSVKQSTQFGALRKDDVCRRKSRQLAFAASGRAAEHQDLGSREVSASEDLTEGAQVLLADNNEFGRVPAEPLSGMLCVARGRHGETRPERIEHLGNVPAQAVVADDREGDAAANATVFGRCWFVQAPSRQN